MPEGFTPGLAVGLFIGMVIWNHFSSKDHIKTMEMMNRHLDWLRRFAEQKQQREDAADWWKPDPLDPERN